MSTVRLAALAALALWSAVANAQVYRIVGPDGKVTFSDRPPADGKATPAAAVALPSGGSAIAALPTELRNAASRYPLTLYTRSDCGPCLSARSFLSNRGVPFTERTVNTNEDAQALGRLMGGSPALPFATLGAQHLRGFAEPEWSQLLDAAGYPRSSQLPPRYQNPAPTPLVAVQAPPPPAARAPQAEAQRAPEPEAPSSNDQAPANPAGIRF
jgi:glutaredoxin